MNSCISDMTRINATGICILRNRRLRNTLSTLADMNSTSGNAVSKASIRIVGLLEAVGRTYQSTSAIVLCNTSIRFPAFYHRIGGG